MDDDRSHIGSVTPTILVAESEVTARTSLSELLREEGYRVVEAADSTAAVNQLHESLDIKIILADLEMPSWTTIIQLARHRLPEFLILGMLRYGAIENGREAQRLGVRNYLIKPLDFGEVNDWVQRCLSGRSWIKT
jgi:DNA-binding NtrC family response regulator